MEIDARDVQLLGDSTFAETYGKLIQRFNAWVCIRLSPFNNMSTSLDSVITFECFSRTNCYTETSASVATINFMGKELN
jgi:hypothetical protein